MRRQIIRAITTAAICAVAALIGAGQASAQQKKPNILVIFGDDIGMWNITHGMMGRTPSIDSIAKDGMLLTDHCLSIADPPFFPRSPAPQQET